MLRDIDALLHGDIHVQIRDVVLHADDLLEPRIAGDELHLLHDHRALLASSISASLSLTVIGWLMPTQRVAFRSSVTRTHLPPVQNSRAAIHAIS